MNLTKAQLDSILARARGQAGPIGPQGVQGAPGARGRPGPAGADVRDIEVSNNASLATLSPIFGTNVIIIGEQGIPLEMLYPGNPIIDSWIWDFRIRDNGTTKAITWDSVYRGIGFTLPTATVAGKLMYFRIIYNTQDDKMDVVSYVHES